MNITLKKSGFTAIIRSKGAELISLKDQSGIERIWEGNPAFWGKHSPVLFPIVGTLKDNKYYYGTKQYPLSRHGFARDRKFNLIGKTENAVTFSLTASEDTLKVYPFRFELQLIYTLDESGLEIKYKVFNPNDFDLPFSIGAHPAFALSGNFCDYAIEMEKDENLQYYLLENDLLSNHTATIELSDRQFDLNYKLFENDALVFKRLESKTLTILRNAKPALRVHFDDFPNLGIWTKANAPFLCVEPWFGYSDSATFNGDILNKEAIQILKPKTHFEAKFSIELFL